MIEIFITETFKKWSQMFPGIFLTYKYDKNTSYHIITVEPKEIYESEEFMKEESKFWDKCSYMFPNNDLIISKPDPIII